MGILVADYRQTEAREYIFNCLTGLRKSRGNILIFIFPDIIFIPVRAKMKGRHEIIKIYVYADTVLQIIR